MTTEERDEKINDIFHQVTEAIEKRLASEECNDKDIAVALKFLHTYEAERLPVPGAATPVAGKVPFPRAVSHR